VSGEEADPAARVPSGQAPSGQAPTELPAQRFVLSAEVLRAAAPGANPRVWLPALQAAFDRWGVDTDLRVCAALGQFAAEAGPDFRELREDLLYTHAERIADVWPSHFRTPAQALPYVGQPELLASRVYSNILGNGPESTTDGWVFRGGGLAQLTGREEYEPFAAAHGLTAEDAADWTSTPEGAAMAGAWYLHWRDCLPLADNWRLTAITRLVNGAAMLGLRERIRLANAALDVARSA
jgi:putative chitinase